MKNIFQRLFDGKIYPSEQATPKSNAYREALHREQEARGILEDTLTDEQRGLMDSMLSAKDEAAYHEYVSIYEEGVRFGVELMVEVYRMGEKGPVILPRLKE